MNENGKPRILLADDNRTVRDCVRRLIEVSKEMAVCGETGNANEVMQLIADCKPSAIILDLSLEGADGLALIGKIHSQYERIPILVLSMHSETTYAPRCIQAGARGYLMKKNASREIINALKAVLKGKVYTSENVKELLASA